MNIKHPVVFEGDSTLSKDLPPYVGGTLSGLIVVSLGLESSADRI